MRTIIKWAAVWLSALSLHAQEDDASRLGSIRVVNAMAPGEGKLMVNVAGKSLYAEGYDLGQRTGAIATPPGSHTVKVEKNGVVTGETTVKVAPQSTTTLIAFAEKVRTKDEAEPFRWEGRVLRLKQKQPERGYAITIVSACEQEKVDVWVMSQSLEGRRLETVYRNRTSVVDLGETRGATRLVLKDNDRVLCNLYPDQKGSYVVVLYNSADNGVGAVSFYDPKVIFAE